MDTFLNNPVGAAVDAYIATINGQFTIEANREIARIRKGKGIPYDPSFEKNYNAALELENFFQSVVKMQVEVSITESEIGLFEMDHGLHFTTYE